MSDSVTCEPHQPGLRIPGCSLNQSCSARLSSTDAPSLRLEVDRFGQIGAERLPGSSYSYSNPGYNTLGALIEVVSREPLNSYLTSVSISRWHEGDLSPDRQVRSRANMLVYRRRDRKWDRGMEADDPPKWPFVRGSGGIV